MILDDVEGFEGFESSSSIECSTCLSLRCLVLYTYPDRGSQCRYPAVQEHLWKKELPIIVADMVIWVSKVLQERRPKEKTNSPLVFACQS